MENKEINPKKDYNLTEIVDKELMGKGKSYFVCKNIITDERWLPEYKRVLNANKLGEGKGASYFIKGRNLIKYLEQNKESKED